MVNHILHELGDRTLCEPDVHDDSAAHISTGPEVASCPACVRSHEQREGLRVSLGLSSARRDELVRRAQAALESGKALDPDSAISLTPTEVLHLLQAGAEEVPGGVLAVQHRVGHWESSGVPDSEETRLVPPAAAADGRALKPDHNYHFAFTDVEADLRARDGHGWVRALPGNVKAKCGGTRSCGVCRREQELVDAGVL